MTRYHASFDSCATTFKGFNINPIRVKPDLEDLLGLVTYCVLDSGLIYRVVSELSNPFLWICSLGREKHIFQYEHGSEVNIFLSISLYDVFHRNRNYLKIFYSTEIKFAIDGLHISVRKFKKTYIIITFPNRGALKPFVYNLTNQWLNQNMF